MVDLDQTVIHATVDPTVAEWQQDENNPNHHAVKDVQSFQLTDDGPGARDCRYYIKLRPGLKDFLAHVSRLYELHIYTMGTRAYAQHIAAIVDPDRRIFGDRILSRDESGSLTVKNLQRLFPVDTKMVVIIDDRGDVWHWSDNLIKVSPYDFFVGIGDINSSFLPKKPEIQTGPRILKLKAPKLPGADPVDGAAMPESGSGLAPESDMSASSSAPDAPLLEATAETTGDVSTLDRLVSMGGGADPTVLQQRATKQDEALTAQREDRPLLQKQKQLDAEDDAAAAAAAAATSTGAVDEHDQVELSTEPVRPARHNLLHDDDTELRYLERSLTELHRTFYDEYDRRLTKARGGRLAALRGEKMNKKRAPRDELGDLDLVPDIKSIMPPVKRAVLDGVVLVFSGVLPLGTDIPRFVSGGFTYAAFNGHWLTNENRSDIALWANSFGAHVAERVNRRTTHLIAGRSRTNKVRQAARRPHIAIVTPQWLLHSISQWRRLGEEDYSVPIDPRDRERPPGTTPEDSVGMLSSDENYDEDNDDPPSGSNEADNNSNVDQDEGGDDNNDDDDEDDLEGVRPAELEGNLSPVDGFFENYAWKEVDSELAEFLGSEGEDSDRESTNSNSTQSSLSLAIGRKRKRSRSSTPSESDDFAATAAALTAMSSSDYELTDDPSGSRLAKRQQRARQRTTGLKTVANVTDVRSSLPTPENTGEEGEEEEQDEEEKVEGDEDEGEEDEGGGTKSSELPSEYLNGDDELERALREEMERTLGAEGSDL